MLFGISPLFALLPLVLYIILAFRDVHPLFNVGLCVVITAILTGQNLLAMGSVLGEAMGSFLGLIGLIIMLGSALGAVLQRTGVAEHIVRSLMGKIGINNERRAILAVMVVSALLVTLLGTLAGANAIIAPLVIPLVALIGLSPSTLAAVFQGAGQTGLFLGPFSPQVVTIMGLTGLSYGDYLLSAGLPVAVTCWLVTWFMARRIQKKTAGVYQYPEEDKAGKEYSAPRNTKQATWIFGIVMLGLLAYGVLSKGGAAYAVVVMVTAALATGYGARLKTKELFDAISTGAARMVWLFLMFVLFHPFITFIEQAGAFKALVKLLDPLLDGASRVLLSLVTTLTGIFGIGGAAVAQSVVMHNMFKGLLAGAGISMGLWALILLVGSQITSFAYPEADMVGQMGLARSRDLKSMVKLGLAIVAASVLLVTVRAVIG